MRYPACRSRHCWLVGSIASLLTCGSASSAELSGFDCLIEPHSVAEVSTRELGTIAEISVVRGDLIEKDQQLARLESSVEEAAVALERGRTEMVANIDARHANVRFLERQRDRVGELYEKKALLRALYETGGDKLAAARLLKVGKSTLYRKLKRYGIH